MATLSLNVPEMRRFYGMEHGAGYDAWRRTSIVATPFDFDKAESTRPKGHCVAVRVTSEDPDDGFKPTSGKLQVGIAKYLVFLISFYLFSYHGYIVY